jgi:xanthine dehydrogenase small subunit
MAKPDSTLRFLLDGQVVEAHVSPTTTVLQLLRDDLGRCGTKEGCAEGDCGACTVLVGDADGDEVRYQAVNSCIRFAATLHGKELVTVESLKQPDGSLHPVQNALVKWHASQCGFCTPGFVMSLAGLYINNAKPARAEVVDALSGNLCRCTGYRPIIDAGVSLGHEATPSQFGPGCGKHAARARALTELSCAEGLELKGESTVFYAPRREIDFQRFVHDHPDALILAGGTDIGLWVTKHLRDLPKIAYIGDIEELKRIEIDDVSIRIGAAVSLTDALAAITGQFPEFEELAMRFASPPVRNNGTLCGNIANGSPIGDSMPPLIALGARVVLRSMTGQREIALEDLYLAYQKKDMARSEYVAALIVPRGDVVPGKRTFAAYKLAKRFDQDISSVCAGILVGVRDGQIAGVRIALGGMAATPKRASHAEAAMLGAPFDMATMQRAAAALALDFKPIDDMRATSDYRMRGAQNLMTRFALENSEQELPVRVMNAVAV